jgi:hypothetical protein
VVAQVNAVTFLLIKLSSSLTLKLLGVIRNIGLVSFSVVFFRESFTSLQVRASLRSCLQQVGQCAGWSLRNLQ